MIDRTKSAILPLSLSLSLNPATRKEKSCKRIIPYQSKKQRNILYKHKLTDSAAPPPVPGPIPHVMIRNPSGAGPPSPFYRNGGFAQLSTLRIMRPSILALWWHKPRRKLNGFLAASAAYPLLQQFSRLIQRLSTRHHHVRYFQVMYSSERMKSRIRTTVPQGSSWLFCCILRL